jgi:hypothetical protein
VSTEITNTACLPGCLSCETHTKQEYRQKLQVISIQQGKWSNNVELTSRSSCSSCCYRSVSCRVPLYFPWNWWQPQPDGRSDINPSLMRKVKVATLHYNGAQLLGFWLHLSVWGCTTECTCSHTVSIPKLLSGFPYSLVEGTFTTNCRAFPVFWSITGPLADSPVCPINWSAGITKIQCKRPLLWVARQFRFSASYIRVPSSTFLFKFVYVTEFVVTASLV